MVTFVLDFMLAGKILTDYTNFVSPYDFDKNDRIIFSYFKDAWNKFVRSSKIYNYLSL